MLHSDVRVGQEVSFRHKGVKWIGRVVKVNPKNIKVACHTPSTTRYNVAPVFLTLEDGTTAPSPTATFAAPFYKGNVVKCPALGTDLYVVLGSRSGTYSLAVLGGNEGRYYNSIEGSLLELVNFDVAGV